MTVFSAPGGVCFFFKFVPRGYFFLFLNLHPGVIFKKKTLQFFSTQGVVISGLSMELLSFMGWRLAPA